MHRVTVDIERKVANIISDIESTINYIEKERKMPPDSEQKYIKSIEQHLINSYGNLMNIVDWP